MTAWLFAAGALVVVLLCIRWYRRSSFWPLRVLWSTVLLAALLVFAGGCTVALLPSEVVEIFQREVQRAGWKGAAALGVTFLLSVVMMTAFLHADSDEDSSR